MTPPLSDRDLDQLLASLPRQSASAGFTNEVLADLEGPARPPTARRWALAAAAAATVAALALWLWPAAPVAPPRQAETQRLMEEHRRLVRELELLKAQMPAQEVPVLYLGGDESLDLVLDLGPVLRGQAPAGPMPAALGGPIQATPAPQGAQNGGPRR